MLRAGQLVNRQTQPETRMNMKVASISTGRSISWIVIFCYLPQVVSSSLEVVLGSFEESAGVTHVNSPPQDGGESTCQRITVDGCRRRMPWNQTMFPNLLGHVTQLDAVKAMRPGYSLHSMMMSNCSTAANLLICGVLTPVCVKNQLVRPCRKFCEDVMLTCKAFRTVINCNLLDNKEPCFGNEHSIISWNQETKPICPGIFTHGGQIKLMDGTVINDCSLPCALSMADANYFGDNPAKIRQVLGIMAAVCLGLCLFTLLTFLIDTQRFRYPERSLVFMCLCFISISVCYLTSCLYSWRHNGKLLTCSRVDMGGGGGGWILSHGLTSAPCIILFLLTYIPWFAAAMWFVILSITWFLAASLKWSHEAIEKHSTWFHAITWTTPTILALLAVFFRTLIADPVSGICMPNADNTMYRVFVLIPHILYLSVGSAFLLFGFISLFKTRNVMRYEGTRTDKLERLMSRIGLFALFYLVPSLVVCAGNYHQHAMTASWMTWWTCHNQPSSDHRCPMYSTVGAQRPAIEVAVLRHIMLISLGIVVSLWVWCPKTMKSWNHFFSQSCSWRRRYEASV